MRPLHGAVGTTTSDTCSALPLCETSEAVPFSAKLNFILTWIRMRVQVWFRARWWRRCPYIIPCAHLRLCVTLVIGHDAHAATPQRIRRVHTGRVAQGRLRPPEPAHNAAAAAAQACTRVRRHGVRERCGEGAGRGG